MKSPLLFLSSSFCLGILLAQPESWGRPTPSLDQAFRIAAPLASAGICMLVGLVALRVQSKWSSTRPERRSEVGRWASFIVALAGFTCAGAATARLFQFRFPPNHISHLESWGLHAGEPIYLDGTLVSRPLRTPYGLRFVVQASRLERHNQARPVTGKVRLLFENSHHSGIMGRTSVRPLQYGDSIHALVRLRRPRNYQNPGSFDFRSWMELIEDIYWEGTIDARAPENSHVLLGHALLDRGPTVAGLLALTREHLFRDIDRLFPPWSRGGREGAVLKAVLLGERSSVDSDTVESFRKSGLYHLLVIAGLHVGLLASLAELLLRRLGFRESWRSGLLLLFLFGYAGLVEQRAPTLRATLMIGGYLVARFLYRQHSALNAIGLAALLLLLTRPPWLFESGFQLSFCAALLIAGVAAPILERTTEPYRSALFHLEAVDRDPSLAPSQAQFRVDLRSLVGAMKARSPLLERHPTLATLAVTSPLKIVLWAINIVLFSALLQVGLLLPMAEIFHRVTFAGIGLNAVAIPLMTILLGLSVPTIVLGAWVPALAVWPAKVVEVILEGLFALTQLPETARWLSYRVPTPPLWVALGSALSIIAAGCFLGRSRLAFWMSAVSFGIFTLLVCLDPFPPQLPTDALELTALDCGDGNATLLVLPDRTTILVGAGGSRRARPLGLGSGHDAGGPRWGDPGENIVSPYLWSRGIKKIDILVLPDAHGDHLNGSESIVSDFRVRELWHGLAPLAPAYAALLEQADRRGVRVRQVAAGDGVSRSTATVQVLWPPPSRQGLGPRDDSLVIRVSDGERSALLVGDLGKNVERALLESGVPLRSEVLTAESESDTAAPFHAELLARISPRVIIFSAPIRNVKGLFQPETVDPSGLGIPVLWTDWAGAVTVQMKNGSSFVHSYAQGRKFDFAFTP